MKPKAPISLKPFPYRFWPGEMVAIIYNFLLKRKQTCKLLVVIHAVNPQRAFFPRPLFPLALPASNGFCIGLTKNQCFVEQILTRLLDSMSAYPISAKPVQNWGDQDEDVEDEADPGAVDARSGTERQLVHCVSTRRGSGCGTHRFDAHVMFDERPGMASIQFRASVRASALTVTMKQSSSIANARRMANNGQPAWSMHPRSLGACTAKVREEP